MKWPTSAVQQKAEAAAGSELPTSKPQRNADDHDELQNFLQELQTEAQKLSTQPAKQPDTTTTTHTPSSDKPKSVQGQLDPVSESLLPTTMSCREVFDSAFYCQSVGGQFNNVYRYGNLRDCGQKWSDLWFCMRLSSYRGSDKADLIRDHYRQREKEKYGRPGAGEGKSSEDIWKARSTIRPPGSLFFETEPVLSERVQKFDVGGKGRFARGYELEEGD